MFTALWAQVLYAMPISDALGCVPVHFNQCERQCLHLRIRTCAFACCTKKGFKIFPCMVDVKPENELLKSGTWFDLKQN